MALDLSNLSPADAQAALRSYPRRYRAALLPVDDPDVEERTLRVGPEGRSAVEIVSDVTRTWVLLGEALRQIAVADTPVVHAAVVDPTERHWEAPAPGSPTEALDLLADAAEALAAAVATLPITDWSRSGTVAGGGQVQAIEVVREAVRVGHDGLQAAEATLAAVS